LLSKNAISGETPKFRERERSVSEVEQLLREYQMPWFPFLNSEALIRKRKRRRRRR
jgi:hypothetical protein